MSYRGIDLLVKYDFKDNSFSKKCTAKIRNCSLKTTTPTNFFTNLFSTTVPGAAQTDELLELEDSQVQPRRFDDESEKVDEYNENDDQKLKKQFFKRLVCARSIKTKEFKLDCSNLKRPRRRSKL